MTVYFSKTERIDRSYYKATVSPASARKGVEAKNGDYISDSDFFGKVESIEKSEMIVWCRVKFPCVGRPYKIEHK